MYMQEREQRKYNFQGHYRKGVLYRAIEGHAISHKGNAFSVLLRIKKYEVKYKYVNRILFWSWREFERTPCPDYSAFEEDRTYWEDHGLFGLNYIYYSFTHTFNESRDYKRVGEFVNVTVEVSEELSKQIYEKTMKSAENFRDYLLTQRSFGLIISKLLPRQNDYFENGSDLCISISGIYSTGGLNYMEDGTPRTTIGIEFFENGLKPLGSIANCYGLAMAILADLPDRPEYYINCRPYKYRYVLDFAPLVTGGYLDSAVCIQRSKQEEPVVLEDW